MHRKSGRIDKIRAIAASQERSSCRQMGESQRKLDEEVQRLEELEGYRLGYEQQKSRPGSSGAAQWADYQHFLRRLEAAVAAQAQVVLDSRQKADLHRQHWLKRRQRLESLTRVVDRCRRDEAAADERREQKTMDELTTGGIAGYRSR